MSLDNTMSTIRAEHFPPSEQLGQADDPGLPVDIQVIRDQRERLEKLTNLVERQRLKLSRMLEQHIAEIKRFRDEAMHKDIKIAELTAELKRVRKETITTGLERWHK